MGQKLLHDQFLTMFKFNDRNNMYSFTWKK